MDNEEKYIREQLNELLQVLLASPQYIPNHPDPQLFFSPHEIIWLDPEMLVHQEDRPTKFLLLCSMENAMLVQEVIDEAKKITGSELFKVLNKGKYDG